jgi:predicted dehydrogenase
MSEKELRVAVVGAGQWAERAHIPGWQRDGRAEVTALVDLDGDLGRRVADDFGIKRVVTDYREILDDPSIDVVDVASGNEAHFEVSMASLEAGKHVLCEKPVHHDASETSRAAALAESKGLRTKHR